MENAADRVQERIEKQKDRYTNSNRAGAAYNPVNF